MNFESIGMIETKGLLSSIEATDAMLKAADVRLFKKEHAGAGLTIIIVMGNVSAVTASVSAGFVAAERIAKESVCHLSVIPRPDEQVIKCFARSVPSKISWPNPNPGATDPDTWVVDISEEEPEEETPVYKEDKNTHPIENDVKDLNKESMEMEDAVTKSEEKKEESTNDLENAEKDLVSDSEDKKEDVNIKEETDESTEEEKTLDLLTPESLLENKEIEGVEKTISKLRRYRVRELRELYYNLAIDNSTDIEVEKATKTQLLEGIKSYLED